MTDDGQTDEMQTGPLAYCLFETGFGICGIAWSATGIRSFRLPAESLGEMEAELGELTGMPAPAEPPDFVGRAIELLRGYFAGKETDFSELPLDLTGFDTFSRAVLTAARAVPWGELSSYGALAREVSDVSAARAVGQVMAHNPLPVIIPCHRILSADGRLGGFSAPGGTVTKTRLIALEGALKKSPVLAQTQFDF